MPCAGSKKKSWSTERSLLLKGINPYVCWIFRTAPAEMWREQKLFFTKPTNCIPFPKSRNVEDDDNNLLNTDDNFKIHSINMMKRCLHRTRCDILGDGNTMSENVYEYFLVTFYQLNENKIKSNWKLNEKICNPFYGNGVLVFYVFALSVLYIWLMLQM